MSARELLLIRREDAFALVDGALPEAKPGLALQDSLAPIVAAAARICGARPTFLMRLLDSKAGNLNVLHCEDAQALAEWRRLEDLDAFVPPPFAAAVAASRDGPPWYQPSFHGDLLDFATAELETHGRVVGTHELVRVSPLSCIYRLQCRSETYWIKATRPGAFAPEAEIMTALSSAFPALVPAPLALRKHQMLTADFGVRLAKGADVSTLTRFLAAFADLQIRSGPLRELPGLQSWRLEDLPRDLEASRPVLGPDADRLLARVDHDVEALGALGMEACLVHGDLYWGNVALDGERIRIFDWADAGVSHPFFDPIDIRVERDPERKHALTQAYLAPWRAQLAVDVDAAWAIASRLAPAHHLTRNTRLLSCLEPFERANYAGGERFFADALRASYPAG